MELDYKCLVPYVFCENVYCVTHVSLSLLISSSIKAGSRPTRLQPPHPLAPDDLGTSKKNQKSEYIAYINFNFNFLFPLSNSFGLPYWAVVLSKKERTLR